jgi:hypothetical protein
VIDNLKSILGNAGSSSVSKCGDHARPLATALAAEIPATSRQIVEEIHLSQRGVTTHIRARSSSSTSTISRSTASGPSWPAARSTSGS